MTETASGGSEVALRTRGHHQAGGPGVSAGRLLRVASGKAAKVAATLLAPALARRNGNAAVNDETLARFRALADRSGP